jgi:hypothetical protein
MKEQFSGILQLHSQNDNQKCTLPDYSMKNLLFSGDKERIPPGIHKSGIEGDDPGRSTKTPFILGREISIDDYVWSSTSAFGAFFLTDSTPFLQPAFEA